MTRKEALAAGLSVDQCRIARTIITQSHSLITKDHPDGEMQGIYLIAALVKDQPPIVYIGSTCSISGITRTFHKRFAEHLTDLQNGTKKSYTNKTTYWQNHYNKHGSNNYLYFVLELIGPLSGIAFVRERETYYIEYWRNSNIRMFNGKNHDGAGLTGEHATDPTWLANVTAANRKKAKDPDYLANVALGIIKRSKNLTYLAANATTAKRRSQNAKWRANNAAAMAKLSKNPIWIANNLAAMRELSKNPTWIANNAAAAQRAAKDPITIANRLSGIRMRSQRPTWIVNHAAAMRKTKTDPIAKENRATANRTKAENPTWQENIAAANREKAQDPRWIANNATAMRKRFDDPELLAKHAAAMSKTAEDPTAKANRAAANQKKAIDRRTEQERILVESGIWTGAPHFGITKDPAERKPPADRFKDPLKLAKHAATMAKTAKNPVAKANRATANQKKAAACHAELV